MDMQPERRSKLTFTRQWAFIAGAALLAVVAAVLYLNRPATLENLKAKADYSLMDVRQTGIVPRHFVEDLEPGLVDIEDPEQRKDLFVRILLPIILHENEKVGADSAIPVSLVLAQAALESGWGTARFSVEGNALFGQRTYNEAADGIAPEDAEEGFRVKAFGTLQSSVASYFNNLNSHHRYEAFREARKALRDEGKKPGPFKLLAHLKAYSEEGAEYLEKLTQVITVNNFRDFDKARLQPD